MLRAEAKRWPSKPYVEADYGPGEDGRSSSSAARHGGSGSAYYHKELPGAGRQPLPVESGEYFPVGGLTFDWPLAVTSTCTVCRRVAPASATAPDCALQRTRAKQHSISAGVNAMASSGKATSGSRRPIILNGEAVWGSSGLKNSGGADPDNHAPIKLG